MDEIRTIPVAPMDMLSMSVLVLFVGFYLNRRFRLLADNFIPPAVTGGILFALGTWLVHEAFDIRLELDMRLRDLLLLVFFSTVGLSARLRMLAAGGKALGILVVVAAVFLFLQNAVGIGLAMLFGVNPGYGLLAGSISFAGGHGTAIAWGAVAEGAGLARANEIGLAFATFGLVSGGLIGGPIARRIMQLQGIEGPSEEARAEASSGAPDATEGVDDHAWLIPTLASLAVLAVCVSFGDVVNRTLADRDLDLPGFLSAMFVGILVTNFADVVRRPVARQTIDRFGEVSLNVFLAMSMMSIKLWALGDAASLILVVLAVQILLMTIFAIRIVHRVMGGDYDAVVIATGFAGLGLGATPVAIANMDAVTMRYGPSTKAFLVVPLVGAFFIDLLNAGTINFFIRLIRDHLA